jgi:hypothetical protein
MQWWRDKQPRHINWRPPDPVSVAARADARADWEAKAAVAQAAHQVFAMRRASILPQRMDADAIAKWAGALVSAGLRMERDRVVIDDREKAVAWFGAALVTFDALNPEAALDPRRQDGDATCGPSSRPPRRVPEPLSSRPSTEPSEHRP